ncbi:imidazole glycerol phosphate synthase subunit HisF [Eubacteriales bacterium OttesenSCG-928-G02]|nr:imidazole glycerol phosphate synthase subunit HisF [Eubacteriales bacterium OttesenSCG-928-G02]
MLTKRIIPCLDVKNGRVVKGVNFMGLKDIASPVELAEYYNTSGADELVFYDITASHEGRGLFTDALTQVAEKIFIPLTVGGSINSIDDFHTVLKCGADKVSVNSGAVKNPFLIKEAAKKYGDQCVVLSMDVKRVNNEFHVFLNGGRIDTEKNAVEWAVFGMNNGAGELVINSMDTDGVRNGFDIELLQEICSKVNIPVIASGGAGCEQHFIDLFEQIPTISAGLAASIFHKKEVDINNLKNILKNKNIPVRI